MLVDEVHFFADIVAQPTYRHVMLACVKTTSNIPHQVMHGLLASNMDAPATPPLLFRPIVLQNPCDGGEVLLFLLLLGDRDRGWTHSWGRLLLGLLLNLLILMNRVRDRQQQLVQSRSQCVS